MSSTIHLDSTSLRQKAMPGDLQETQLSEQQLEVENNTSDLHAKPPSDPDGSAYHSEIRSPFFLQSNRRLYDPYWTVDSERKMEQAILEKLVNMPKIRQVVGPNAILQILQNASRVRIAILDQDARTLNLAKSDLVTECSAELFIDIEEVKRYLWIAIGSSDGIKTLVEKAPSEYLIEYLRPVQSWTPKFRVGRWKNVVPVGPALFPGIAIEISDMAADMRDKLDGLYTLPNEIGFTPLSVHTQTQPHWLNRDMTGA